MTDSSVASYDFLSPQRIVFGWGRWPEIAPLAARFGKRAFLVIGSRTLIAGGFVGELRDALSKQSVDCVELAVSLHEPEVADVDAAVSQIRRHKIGAQDLVIGVGGGSAIDLAKAVAALATNTAGETVQDYLEGVGRGLAITEPPLPMLAMPTTAGTGSEATKNAVISSYAPAFKKSLRSDLMVPRAIVVDPRLTVSLPPAATAHTGMDAITQLIESYISKRAKPIPQALAVEGLRLAVPAIGEAVRNGHSRPAREAMAHAALLSGIALANSGLGLAHGVAAALGVHYRVPHGLACAVMLPVALRVNREISQRQLAELARACGLAAQSSDEAAADAFLEKIDALCEQVGVPRRLSALGVKREHLPALVRDSRGNSMDGNPRSVSDDELARILEAQL